MKKEFSIIDALAEHGWVPVFAKWRGSQGHYWCATTGSGNMRSERVDAAAAQAIKSAWEKAIIAQPQLANTEAVYTATVGAAQSEDSQALTINNNQQETGDE